MADFIAWSHSRRNQYDSCPRQFWHNTVAPKGSPDRIEFKQTPAMLAGLEIDDALTKRISANVPLPPQYAPYEGMVQAVLAAPGQKFTQMHVALDQAFKPCGYRDWDRAWIRSIYDLAIIDGSHAFIADWKAGQVWLDEGQLKLFAATAFHVFPELDTVDSSYVWLKHGITSDKSYRRKDLPDMWSDLLPTVERLQASFKSNHWPAAPKRGAKTCGWCPANKMKRCAEAQGPYNGK